MATAKRFPVFFFPPSDTATKQTEIFIAFSLPGKKTETVRSLDKKKRAFQKNSSCQEYNMLCTQSQQKECRGWGCFADRNISKWKVLFEVFPRDITANTLSFGSSSLIRYHVRIPRKILSEYVRRVIKNINEYERCQLIFMRVPKDYFFRGEGFLHIFETWIRENEGIFISKGVIWRLKVNFRRNELIWFQNVKQK